MPYRLRISNEEVEAELRKMGFNEISEEMVESFRKDLLKLIKHDLRKLKESQRGSDSVNSFQKAFIKDNAHHQPSTSTPSSYAELEQEKWKSQAEESSSCEYASSSLESESELKTSELITESSNDKDSGVAVKSKTKTTHKKGKNEEVLPSYPSRPDPVNLYHYYKAHWDKYKVPGEDPRSGLRWDIRSKLFYSS